MSRRRGYRELQADAARGTVTCPHCHSTFVPGEAEQTASLPALPDGFPVLSAEQFVARIADHQQATERLHGELRRGVAESAFHLWLSSVRLVGADGDTLYAVAASEVVHWVRDRFGRVLDEAASALASRPMRVVVAPMDGAS